MATSVYLIRHAAHVELGRYLTGRKEGVRLSEAGERQAAALGERMRGAHLAAIHTSPQRRARATAAAIADRAGVDVHVAPALDEIDYGQWTGASFAALDREPLWQRWNEARSTVCPPGGETMAAAVARMIGHLEHIARFHPDAAVACVSHCDTIRGAVAHYLGLPLEGIFRFDIDCASVTALSLDREGAHLTGLNERAAT